MKLATPARPLLYDQPVRLEPLVAANLAALDEGLELLQRIPDAVYTQSCRPVFQSFMGAHFRHLLEHYQCFLLACENADQQITILYDARPRANQLETSREQAIASINTLHNRLQSLLSRFNKDYVCVAQDQADIGLVPSTLARELLFLQSHTIHHYAMIAGMCRMHDVAVADDFGVAIATQAFEAAQRACNKGTRGSC